MEHASTSCLQACSSVSSVHATAYEAIDHMAITATVLVACVLYDATACWRSRGAQTEKPLQLRSRPDCKATLLPRLRLRLQSRCRCRCQPFLPPAVPPPLPPAAKPSLLSASTAMPSPSLGCEAPSPPLVWSALCCFPPTEYPLSFQAACSDTC